MTAVRNDDENELNAARRLVAARRRQRESERRRARDVEHAKWLQQTRDSTIRRSHEHALRATDLLAQELALVQTITQRQGFLEQQLAAPPHVLSPLAQWHHQLQLIANTAPLRSPTTNNDNDDNDDNDDAVDSSVDTTSCCSSALAALELALTQDVACTDVVYATGSSAADAAVTLLECSGDTTVDELLSAASVRNGVARRVTCTRHGARVAFVASAFVRDFDGRAAQLLKRSNDVALLLELLWEQCST